MGLKALKDFRTLLPNSQHVLLVEPNMFHAEILPGFCRYIVELGYVPIVILRRVNYESDVFCRFPDHDTPKRYCMSPLTMRLALRCKTAKSAKLIFLASFTFGQPFGFWGPFTRYLGYVPQGTAGVVAVEHCLEHVAPFIDRHEVDLDRLFLLRAARYRDRTISALNPHYFGKVDAKPLGHPAVFISVGSSVDRKKGLADLVAAVRELEAEGFSSFSVLIVGKHEVPQALLPLPRQIRMLGRLCFAELFSAMENSDFYLPLLDPTNQEHECYLEGKTSGSHQLILGFSKVPLVHKALAAAYGYASDCAVEYESGSLGVGMRQALAMHPDEYEQRRGKVQELAAATHRNSLAALQRILSAPSSQTSIAPQS